VGFHHFRSSVVFFILLLATLSVAQQAPTTAQTQTIARPGTSHRTGNSGPSSPNGFAR